MSDSASLDPVQRYRTVVSWRIVEFAHAIANKVPTEAQLEDFEENVLRGPEAKACKTAHVDPYLNCLLAVLEAEEDRTGPVGGILCEENHYDRRLYDILIARIIRRFGARIDDFIDYIDKVLMTYREAPILGENIRRVRRDILTWRKILDSGQSMPHWVPWPAPNPIRVMNDEYPITAIRVIDTETVMLVLVNVPSEGCLRITTELSCSAAVSVRVRITWNRDGTRISSRVRRVPRGKSTWSINTAGHLDGVEVWSRKIPD